MPVDVGRDIVAAAQVDEAAGVDEMNVVAKVLDSFRAVDTQRYLNTSIVNGKKVKVRIALYGQIHDRATERHLPYGITQCYLPPDTGERAPP